MSFELILPFLRPIEPLLLDDSISEIMGNPDASWWYERDGIMRQEATISFNAGQLRTGLEVIANQLGKKLDEDNPLLHAQLPDGSRLAAVIPPVVRPDPALTIRKFTSRHYTIDDLIARGTLTRQLADFLGEQIRNGKTLLISGGTGTGKTTLLRILADFIPDDDRIVVIEDTSELQIQKPNIVPAECQTDTFKASISFDDLLKSALRWRPDRIILGEVRGVEARTLLDSFNTGHAGSLATIHANSAEKALRHTSQRVLTSCGQALLGLTSILWARPRTGGYRWQRSRQNSKSNERSTLMTNKPNILLVHGAWGDASHWRHVIPPLHEKGYCVFAVQNPLTSLSDDIDRTIKMAAAQDAPTLLVGHAYGCAVITSAGLTPNVVGLVYLAGPALDEGESLKSLWARRAPPEGAANIREDKYGFLWIEVGKFHETFCHDLEDRTESLVWALTQKPTASRCFEEKSGPPAWKVKPSWYQISANDRLIPTETEKWMAERINARRTITLPTSHASIATRPDDIVQLIEEASNAVVAKAAGFR